MKKSDLLSSGTHLHMKATVSAPLHEAAIRNLENSLGGVPEFTRLKTLTGGMQDARSPWERFGNNDEASIFRRIIVTIGWASDLAKYASYAESYMEASIRRVSDAPRCVDYSDPVLATISKEMESLSLEARGRLGMRLSDFMKASPELRRRIAEADTPEKQAAFVSFLGKRRSEIDRERAARERELKRIGRDIAHLKLIEDVMQFIKNPTALEAATESFVYKLRDAYSSGIILRGNCMVKGDDFYRLSDESISIIESSPEIFIVQHNWKVAFQNASALANDEWRLPAQECVFEFQFVAHRALVFFGADDGVPTSATVFIRCKDNIWVDAGDISSEEIAKGGNDPFTENVLANIRAICIALDAHIVEKKVTRVPHLSNQKRVQAGRVAMDDFHILSLTARSRATPLDRSTSGEQRHQVRLHFRRGHWRHFVAHKTWINWMLVGNPDLGFIDKQYKL